MDVREQIAMYLDQIEDFELLMCVYWFVRRLAGK